MDENTSEDVDARIRTACERGAGVIRIWVKTINSPRPPQSLINEETIFRCLFAEEADPELSPVMKEFFMNVSQETLRNLVDCEALHFEDLNRALHIWDPTRNWCPYPEWIKQMAIFERMNQKS